MHSPQLVDPALDAALQRDGYVVIADFLDAAEVATLQRAFEELDDAAHREPFGASILSNDVTFRGAVDRVIRGVLAPKAVPLFNDYRYCFSNFVVKQPQSDPVPAGEVPLHQDVTFVDETRYVSLGLWCPLVDTTLENGCLCVVPGSHQFNRGPRPVGWIFPYRHLAGSFDLVPVPMKAGSVMIFSQRLFHASRPNTGSGPRVAAGGLVVPREAQLYCYYQDLTAPGRVEIYAVDDLFYTRYPYRTRPDRVPRVATIDYWHDELTRDQLAG